MEKRRIRVDVSWCERNYGCAWSDEELGTVVVTARTLEGLKRDFEESLRLHVAGCVEDGDEVPGWLARGEYEVDYVLDAAALIRSAERYTTMCAISEASGINQKQLSHYANGVKHPRPLQLQRIRAALGVIGAQLLALG